jgi:hypothetical protein
MLNFTTEELDNIIKGNHTALVMLMPGTSLYCPGKAIIVREQKVQFAMGGCSKCFVHALRAAMQNNQEFAEAIVLALDPSYNP